MRNSSHDASANKQWSHSLLERASVCSALLCGVKIHVLSPPALSAFVCVPQLSLCPLFCFTLFYICVVSCRVTFCLVSCLLCFLVQCFSSIVKYLLLMLPVWSNPHTITHRHVLMLTITTLLVLNKRAIVLGLFFFFNNNVSWSMLTEGVRGVCDKERVGCGSTRRVRVVMNTSLLTRTTALGTSCLQLWGSNVCHRGW